MTVKILYRIHTEHKPGLAEIVADYFDCFALWGGVGYWNGVAEPAACIEILADLEDREQIDMLAHQIRVLNRQEAVYVTESPVTLRTITGKDRVIGGAPTYHASPVGDRDPRHV